MTQVAAFMADGMEEVECLAVVDILRRAEVEVLLVSMTDKLEVTGSHDITIKADVVFGNADFSKTEVLFLPGGMPGTQRLMEHKGLQELLVKFHKENKRLAAICAAPSVLGGLGILDEVEATSHPSVEGKLGGAIYTKKGVITHGTISTGRGLGYALDLGLELVRLLVSPEKAEEIRSAIQYDK